MNVVGRFIMQLRVMFGQTHPTPAEQAYRKAAESMDKSLAELLANTRQLAEQSDKVSKLPVEMLKLIKEQLGE